jgi:hypothetical protein
MRKLLRSAKRKIVKRLGKDASFDKYNASFLNYQEAAKQAGIAPTYEKFPIFGEDTPHTGFDHHYVYQGPWVFEKLASIRPKKHVDIGSLINYIGFFSVLQPTVFVDIRPTKAEFTNFIEVEGSILNLPFEDNSLDSVSCLHVIEHIGLGRYGDPIDPLGTIHAAKELCRVLKPGGHLYVSTPVGREITYFNAHRVTSPQHILDYFGDLKLIAMDGILDSGKLVRNTTASRLAKNNYACGLFHFTKE